VKTTIRGMEVDHSYYWVLGRRELDRLLVTVLGMGPGIDSLGSRTDQILAGGSMDWD